MHAVRRPFTLLRPLPHLRSAALQTRKQSTLGLTTQSNWTSIEEQPLSAESIGALFRNTIPAISVPNFLTKDECSKLAEVVRSHKMGSYNEDVYPFIGTIGVTHFDHQKEKEKYFGLVPEARSLQERFRKETGVDVVSRVAKLLEKASGLPVRIAREDDRDYFAGLLRNINSSALIHADFAPYDGPDWEIGRISAQLTWNIPLTSVHGGESIVYDRFWKGDLDQPLKKAYPSYGYSPKAVENCPFKVISPTQGSLLFFNPRNFHEVKPVDKPETETRFTMSSFCGYLPDEANGPSIILWS